MNHPRCRSSLPALLALSLALSHVPQTLSLDDDVSHGENLRAIPDDLIQSVASAAAASLEEDHGPGVVATASSDLVPPDERDGKLPHPDVVASSTGWGIGSSSGGSEKPSGVGENASSASATTEGTTVPSSSATIPFVKTGHGNNANDDGGGVGAGEGGGEDSHKQPPPPHRPPAHLSKGASKAAVAAAEDGAPPPPGPPEGFKLADRVYTSSSDGKSYFASSTRKGRDPEREGEAPAPGDPQKDKTPFEDDDEMLIPFLECGAVGSTTPPISLRSASFRHFPAGAEPSDYGTAGNGNGKGGKGGAATLVVALNPLEIEVSGGETKAFRPGDVVLLEDTLGGGHKMRAASLGVGHGAGPGPAAGAEGQRDLSVLTLTLPHHHHHHAHRDHHTDRRHSSHHHLSIFGLHKNAVELTKPCRDELDPAYRAILPGSTTNEPAGNLFFRVPALRRIVLGAAGMTLSSLMTYFLTKVAPLKLAVGFGGLCLIAGGTCGMIVAGEKVMEEVELWGERRWFQSRAAAAGNKDSDSETESRNEDNEADASASNLTSSTSIEE